MTSTRVFALSILGVLLSAPLLRAGDLSKYRGFQFGMNVNAIAKQAQLKAADAKVVHQRPALIKELQWQPRRSPSRTPESDAVEEVLFSFYNGELFRMVVTYDRSKTEGLTNEDLIDAISKDYGAAERPDAEIVFPATYEETAKVLGRWEDAQYSYNLVRSSYQSGFGMVVFSKRLDALAREAITEAVRLDKQEAPQREIESRKKEQDVSRLQQEKARTLNKPGFRP